MCLRDRWIGSLLSSMLLLSLLGTSAAHAQTLKSPDNVWMIDLPTELIFYGDPKTKRQGCSGLDAVVTHSSGTIPLRTSMSLFVRDGNNTVVATTNVQAIQSGLSQLQSVNACSSLNEGELVGPYTLGIILDNNFGLILRHSQPDFPVTFVKDPPKDSAAGQAIAEARRQLEQAIADARKTVEDTQLFARRASARARAEGVSPSLLLEPQVPASPELKNDDADRDRVGRYQNDVGVYVGQVAAYIKALQTEITKVRKQVRKPVKATCKRGKQVKVVVGSPPKCPKGFRIASK